MPAIPLARAALDFLMRRVRDSGTFVVPAVSLNPYAAPASPPGPEPLPESTGEVGREAQPSEEWVRRYRQSAFVVVLVAAFVEGLVVGSSSTVQVLVAVTLASAVTLWCGLDARLHRKLFLRSFAWALMFTWPVGAAVHLVWTRGPKGLLTYALASGACIAAAVAGASVVTLAISR